MQFLNLKKRGACASVHSFSNLYEDLDCWDEEPVWRMQFLNLKREEPALHIQFLDLEKGRSLYQHTRFLKPP